MKRLLTSIAAFSLAETVGRHPVVAAGILATIGIGGGAALSLLTPSIMPQPSAYFNANQAFGNTNNALKTNGGTAGAFEPPTTPTNSSFIYFEGSVDANLGLSFGVSNEFASGGGSGKEIAIGSNGMAPAFFAQGKVSGQTGTQWWDGLMAVNVVSSLSGPTTVAGSGYSGGLYNWIGTGGGCAREPAGVTIGGTTSSDIADPGFLCSTLPTINTATIAGNGAKRTTGAGSVATTCASNAPVSGEMTVTAHVGVAHGLSPGLTYVLAGFTPTGYNATYTALTGTSGTTLVGETTTGGGTCPAAVSVEGTALSGVGSTITLPAFSTTDPFGTDYGTGVIATTGQHFCAVVGEYGDDSPFPGAQFFAAVDENGNPLYGSPALVPWLNQGAVNFTGFTVAGTESPSSPALTVTALNAYSITGATFSGSTGFVTFVMASTPGFIPGSEFTLSGVAPSGYNQTYVAVAGTSGTTVVGNPLSGPVGTPQAIGNPGAYSSGGSMVAVIMPGMQVLGASFGSVISPYGTFGATGTGGTGTYGLTVNQATFSFTASISGTTMTVTGTPGAQLVVGEAFSGAGVTSGAIITALGTGTGGAGTYTVNNSQTVSSETMTGAGAIGSSGSPANIFAWPAFYYTATANAASSGGVTVPRSQGSLSDFINEIGSSTANVGKSAQGWGGALANFGMVWGIFPQTTGGAPDQAKLASLCKKSTDFQSFAAANSLTIRSLYRLNDPGLWADSSIAQFTGSIAGTALTIASMQTGSTSSLAAGTVIAGVGVTGCPSACPTVSSGSGSSYTLSASGGTVATEPMTAGAFKPALPIASNSFNGFISGNTLTVTSIGASTGFASFTGSLNGQTLTVSGVTGAIAQGMTITDGGASLTGPPLLIIGGSGTTWTVNTNYYGAISGDSAMTGTFTALVPGQYVLNSSIATPVAITGYGTGAGGVGTYTLSNSANGSVGSSGSPVAFTSTGISGGGAIAPGPALTIDNLGGAGLTFPVTNYGAATGTLALSGSYDASTLGGTPSAIQAQVSATAGGPPISGCSACAWTNLASGVVSGGKWSGQALNIPAGGPYWVSVRAANGTAYATLPALVKVGLTFDMWSEGQAIALESLGGESTSTYTGLFGTVSAQNRIGARLNGPPAIDNYAPAGVNMLAGDRFGAFGNNLYEGVGVFEQNLQNAFGWPITFVDAARDGIGLTPTAIGYVPQYQTIGIGDGSRATWCSAANFCSNPSVAGVMTFNAASLTGGTITGSISGSTLTVSAIAIGALEPGLVLSGSGISGSPTLVACLTNCSDHIGATSTWSLSASVGTIGSEAMTAFPVGGAPTPLNNLQVTGLPFVIPGSFGVQLIKVGTFTVSVNGTVVCQDSNTFAWNIQGGNCTGAGISSSFVNYSTGDFEITFSSPPASSAVITASWTNIVPTDNANNEQLDFMGNGSPTSGFISALFSKFPGGVSGHIDAGCDNDGPLFTNNGYAQGATGYTQMVSWLYGTKYPDTFPGVSASTPFISANTWRGEGPVYFIPSTQMFTKTMCEQWGEDIATKSTFSGTIASSLLTLTSAATGPMWEGEVLGCNPFSLSCSVTPGTYITSLASGTWGASGSTYSLSCSNTMGSCPTADVGSATAMENAVYYQGSGPGIYAGPLNDIVVQSSGLNGTTGYSPHPWNGFAGGRRVGARWAALTWGGLTTPSNASDPTLSRTKDLHCDSSAIAGPCFDIGNTFAASASGTISGATVTFTGGLAANSRPFVVGEALSCSGCTSGRFVTAVSAPPTQSTVSGQGQIGNTFTVTANGSLGVSTTETVTGGCSGTSGTGSNCIDLDFSINTTNGTYGTAAALATCGANNLNGSSANYTVPTGGCQDRGIGSIVRNFRIGTAQSMNSGATGSPFDDGVDPYGGAFNQSAAFTCNIVAATTVQCVKGAAYTSGVPSGVGQWASGATFAEYGDPVVGTGRIASLLGTVGGQSLPFTPGSGYTNGAYTVAATCSPLASGAVEPKVDITVAGGSIVNVYPSTAADAAGYGAGGACTVSLTSLGGGSGGAVSLALAPVEGVGGIATYNTDSNLMGVQMYDNSGFPGNPLSSFFSNGTGGYFEPGLPVAPWGEFLGAAVSG